MRVAFTLIGGRNWTGGYNYLLNLVRALAAHRPDAITPVLCFGEDTDPQDAAPFERIANAQVVRHRAFDALLRRAFGDLVLDGPVSDALRIAYLQVAAGGKRAPGAGEHHAANPVRVVVQPGDEVAALLGHRHVHGVEHIRPVHRHQQHVFAYALGQEGFVGGHCKQPSSEWRLVLAAEAR
jgi:hypothetical protein